MTARAERPIFVKEDVASLSDGILRDWEVVAEEDGNLLDTEPYYLIVQRKILYL